MSAKSQVTIPVEARKKAGLRPGDLVRVEVVRPGEVVLVREDDPIARHAGSLTGVYEEGYLEELRGEWR